MNDNELYALIRASVLEEAPRKDFDDVKRRIELLGKEDGEPDSSVIEVDFYSGKSRKAPGRVIAAAAAVAVAAGIGYAALSSGLSLSGMKSDSAAETAEAASVMYEGDFAPSEEQSKTTISDESVPEESDSTNSFLDEFDELTEDDEEAVSPSDEASESDAVSGRSVKSGAADSDSSTAEAVEAPSSFDSYHINELDLTLSIPSYAYCTGVNVPTNYPPLERMGVSAEKLESNYRSRGIFFNAVWFDDGADVVEIVAAGEDVSEYANSLARFSDYELEQLRQSYLLYGVESPDMPRYYDVSVVTIGKQPYIRALGQDRSGKAYHVQYMTIINGKRIKLSLIEHYTDTEMPEDGVSPAHTELMDSIAASVKYDHVRSQFAYNLSKLRFNAWVSIAGILVLLGYGVKYIIDQRKLAEQQLAEDEETLYGSVSSDAEAAGYTEGSEYAGNESGEADSETSAEPDEVLSEKSDDSPEACYGAASDVSSVNTSDDSAPDTVSDNKDITGLAGSSVDDMEQPGSEDDPE